jgi:uncharacterized protein YicC (UPF0701 family)
MGASSMTGFGRAEINLPGVRLSVEIATVNQKNLQVSVFGPEAWPGLESAAAAWIRARLQRGKVTARVTQAAASSAQRQWDSEAVAASLDELAKLAARCGVKFSADGELLLRLAESSRISDSERFRGSPAESRRHASGRRGRLGQRPAAASRQDVGDGRRHGAGREDRADPSS